MTGIFQPVISKYESNSGNPPTIATLEKFARAYHCTVADLITDRSVDSGNRVREEPPPYTASMDPQLMEIIELLQRNPELKKFCLAQLKALDKEGLGEIGGIVERIISLPAEKRQALLTFLG